MSAKIRAFSDSRVVVMPEAAQAVGPVGALTWPDMNGDSARLWTDRSCLQNVQYRTDANLAARQSIYAYQQPPQDLPRLALELTALRGSETVADIGCGNGAYLAELARRGHTGPLAGVDLSAGMLRAARNRAPAARLLAGDAAALPLRDGACDLTLAMHMLYHVPGPLAAVRELRRVTRRGGQLLVALNGHDHLAELRDLVTVALQEAGGPAVPAVAERIDLDQGADLLGSVFASVTRHDFAAELQIPGPDPVTGYVRSMLPIQQLPDPEAVVAAVASQLPGPADGVFRVRTRSGCLICS